MKRVLLFFSSSSILVAALDAANATAPDRPVTPVQINDDPRPLCST